jgi:hypothetical protein
MVAHELDEERRRLFELQRLPIAQPQGAGTQLVVTALMAPV